MAMMRPEIAATQNQMAKILPRLHRLPNSPSPAVFGSTPWAGSVRVRVFIADPSGAVIHGYEGPVWHLGETLPSCGGSGGVSEARDAWTGKGSDAWPPRPRSR